MKLFPAQLATHLLCGKRLPLNRCETIDERIVAGREMLVRITGVDYGYDLQKWHDHLKESGEGGYTWRRNIVFPKIMKQALESKSWNEAVERLPTELDIDPSGTRPPTASERRRLSRMQRATNIITEQDAADQLPAHGESKAQC